MVLVRFPPLTHFRLRALEWLSAGMLLSLGALLLIPAPVLEQPGMSGMARITDQKDWAYICLCMASVRLVSLYVNGAWRKSPWVRLLTSLLTSLVWLQMLFGLINQPMVNPLIIFLPWLIVADWYSIWRAANDADENRKKPHTSELSV